MSIEETGRHLKFFVGHRRPDFGVWKGFRYCTQSAGIHDHALPSDAALDEVGNARLGEYHSLFLLRRTLDEFAGKKAVVTLCQHRRFVLNVPLGMPSVNQAFARVVSGEVAKALHTDLLVPLRGTWLLGTPLRMPISVLQQYHAHHPLRDLLRFTAQMIDARILGEHECEAFLLSTSFIPAPSCGTFPLDSMIEILDIMERSSLAYLQGGYVERQGYH